MRQGEVIASYVCILSGVAAAAISAAWLIAGWNNAPDFLPEMPEDMMDYGALTAYRSLAELFAFALPVLVAVSAVAGIASWRQLAAKVGLLFAGTAAVIYLLSMQAMMGMIG